MDHNQQSTEEQLKTGQWSHGLCGCFDNLGVCCIAYFVPCVTFGQTRQRLTGGGCVTYGLLYLVPFLDCYLEMKQRGEIRRQRGIDGGSCADLALICCCPLCTLVQEEQEAIELESQRGAIQSGAVIVHQGGTVIVTSTQQQHMYPPSPAAGYSANAPPPYNQVDVKAHEMDRN